LKITEAVAETSGEARRLQLANENMIVLHIVFASLCLLWKACTSSSTVLLGDSISKLIVKRLKGLEKVREHPGHAFGLGCDSWTASRYQGGVRGWSAPGRVRWLAMSNMQMQVEEEEEQGPKTITTDARAASDLKAAAIASSSPLSSPASQLSPAISSNLKSLLDVSGFVLPELDVPHLRLSLSQSRDSSSSYELLLDYIPRQDFLAATPISSSSSSYLAYYDKYYQGLDELAYQTIKEAEKQGLALLPLPPASSTLTRITTSALALRVQIPTHTTTAAGAADEFITRLCEGHLNRWLSWLDAAAATAASSPSPSSPPPAPSTEAASALAREYNLYKLVGEERKYHYAMIFGADFAPKAEEISAAIIGPP